MISFGNSGGGAGWSGNVFRGATGNATVRAIQKALRGLGMSNVRASGMIDSATVAAINGIFGGWDDAPPKLRTGTLTARTIAANLPAVKRYLTQAIGGAQKLLHAESGD